MELMYASLQLLHTDARESTVAAMMKGLAPGCGLCCEDSIRTKVWPLMEATVRALEGEWLTARDEWIHHPNNKMYKSVLVAPVYNSFDVEAIVTYDCLRRSSLRCSEVPPALLQSLAESWVALLPKWGFADGRETVPWVVMWRWPKCVGSHEVRRRRVPHVR